MNYKMRKFKTHYLDLLSNTSNCNYCGFIFLNESQKTLDHIIPKSLGGRNIVENIWVLCKGCNGVKSNRFVFYSLQSKRYKMLPHHKKSNPSST